MICPQCGNDNPSKLKFCVNCGMNLENPSEVNYEQVDMGGYHSEEDSDSGGFSFGSGTFTISDRAPMSSTSSDLYTAEELNDDDEEFDFSSFDEPFIPKLDADRVSLPNSAAPQQVPPQAPGGMFGYPQQPMGAVPPQPMGGMPQQPMGGMPPQMGAMPQQGGVQPMNGMPQQGAPQQMNGMPQQGGMPMYGQAPMMYAQPQIIGYDPNGMPIYGQAPVMYAQPQIIGYDPNGMPIYGQAPMMYAQPQIIGYDPNGMPIYGQAPIFPQPTDPSAQQPMYQQPMGYPQMGGMPQQPMGGMPGMQGMPQYGVPQQPKRPEPDRVDVPDDFWEFFDGGKSRAPEKDAMDDFFGRHSADMGIDPNDPFGARKRPKLASYMNDTPIVDADNLIPNTSAKFNKMFMRKVGDTNSGDLETVSDEPKKQRQMEGTKEVDAEQLNAYEHYKSRISMSAAGEADANDLEAYVPEHKEAIMSQNIEAVEALPKKKTTYNDEIDAIELPEYMQARKAVNDDTPEIPSAPEIG